MKYNSLIIGLSVLALQSCTDNLVYTGTDIEVVLTGNTYQAVFTESSPVSTFNSGNQILLNASGSLQIDSRILTYMDNQWKAENEFSWSDLTGKTNVTAVYPVYPDLDYVQENLYKNNSLEDILYVKDEFPAGNSIHLQFKHLFSLLTLHLEGNLQTYFQKIEVTCPAVSSIIPKSAEIVLADNGTHTTTIAQVSPSGNYSFIVPPVGNMVIAINMVTNGKKYTTQLETKSFTGNKEYTYHLKISEKTPGIMTAEDWIAFSQLINSNTFTQYKGKTLDDFGETINGITTYYLLNDIDFKDVDCTELKQIGYAQTNYYFSQTFDGQNHTLYNIPINSSNGTTGVFGAVNITGIVKNLHIESSKVSITSKSKSTAEGTSILVGRNKGKILNCCVKECQIAANPTKTNQSANTGGIAGTSTGEITNCYVTNTQIIYDANSKIKAGPAGGIAGSSQAQGLIANCYSANNIIKNRESYNGGICGKASDGAHIENCYVYNIDLITTKGLFAGIAANSFFIHNYYDNAKNQEATDAVIDKDGWFHTGDLATMDADEHIFIRGRSKNMLLGPNGQNIYPEEIEDKLNSMAMVNESIVIQSDDKLVALVHPDMEEVNNLGFTDEDLENIMEQNRKELNMQIPSFAKVSRIKLHNQEFEKTAKKSIKRYLYQNAI